MRAVLAQKVTLSAGAQILRSALSLFLFSASLLWINEKFSRHRPYAEQPFWSGAKCLLPNSRGTCREGICEWQGGAAPTSISPSTPAARHEIHSRVQAVHFFCHNTLCVILTRWCGGGEYFGWSTGTWASEIENTHGRGPKTGSRGRKFCPRAQGGRGSQVLRANAAWLNVAEEVLSRHWTFAYCKGQRWGMNKGRLKNAFWGIFEIYFYVGWIDLMQLQRWLTNRDENWTVKFLSMSFDSSNFDSIYPQILNDWVD